MSNVIRLIEEHETWLVRRILGYAKRQGYTRYTSTLEEAWRLSISGLSESLVEGMRRLGEVPEFGPEEAFENDPMTRFGVVEARKHRERGVSLAMFLGLMKYYRQAYLDLLDEKRVSLPDPAKTRLFLERSFDRIEIAFCQEWARTADEDRISELQASNRSMTNEKNAYLTVFESLSDPIVLLGHDDQIVNLNLAAAKLAGGDEVPGGSYYGPRYTPSAPMSSGIDTKAHARAFVHRDAVEVFPWLSSFLAGMPEDRGSAPRRAECVTNIGGETRTFEVVYSRLLDFSEKFTAAILTLRDVTERRRFEDDLLAAREEAEAASHAKSQFLSTMTHEIRTPINAIIGMADVLSDTPLSPMQDRFVSVLRSAGGDLLSLADNVLDISKIEAGQLECERAPFDLANVVERTCRILAHQAREKDLNLAVDLRPDPTPRLIGDGHRLRQVLSNLVGNAVKFTERGGVTVRVRHRTVEPGIAEVDISVRDTGIGIPPDKLEAVFDNFIQVDSSTTRRFGGSGLGLAISKRLVEMMGGEIGVDSAPGRGSRFAFTLRLPIARESEVTEESGPAAGVARPCAPDFAPPPDLLPSRLLLAEDSPSNQAVVEAFLMNSPVRIDIAENGAEAVERFADGRYDLVLMDIEMPVMDGYEAVGRIRAWERESGREPTPIVAMTAHAVSGIARRCLEAGCTDVVTKPIKLDHFLEVVGRFLESVAPDDPVVRVDPVLQPLVPAFLQATEHDVSAIAAHLEQQDFESVRNVGHRMKGDGGTYGFEELVNLGRSIQAAAERRDPDEIRALVSSLAGYLQRVRVADVWPTDAAAGGPA